MKRLFNFFRDHVLEYLLILLALAGVFYLAFASGSYARPLPLSEDPNYYANKIFDQSYVHKIEIEIPEQSYQDLLENPTEKTKYLTNVIIDGEIFADVAFSTRGNVSLFMVADNLESDRYSYKLNFQKFGGENYHGLDKLLLNNLYSDSSYLKDFTVYEIMRAADVPAPLASFTELYINGELKGLYLALEDLDKSFLARNQLPEDSVLYKPEALAHDHYKLKKLDEAATGDEEAHTVVFDANSPNFDFGGADLVYFDDNPSNYPAIFNNSVSKISPHDQTHLLRSLKSLSPISTEDPASFWNVEALAKYFAANNFVINFDGYIGVTAHNYYLLTSESGNTLLPWDYNLAFQGLWNDSTPSMEESVVNWPIDDPLTIEDLDHRPVWKLIASNDAYLDQYHAALQSLLTDYFISGTCRNKIFATADLIRPYVYSDPARFFSIDEFEEGVNLLQDFVSLRSDYVQKQLWGLVPRTKGDKVSDEERSEFLDLQTLIDN